MRMSSRFTRREFAALAGAAPLAAEAQSKAPRQTSPNPGMQQALAGVRKNSSRLQQIAVPIELEPAFSFRASRG